MGAPTDTPLVVVHLVILRQAVCHDCGWQGGIHDSQAMADADADSHQCWGEQWRA